MMPVIRISLPGLPLEVSAYGLFAVLAFLAGALLFRHTLRQAGLQSRTVRTAILITVIGFLIGARLMNLIVHPEAFRPGSGFRPWSLDLANFSLYGGILAVALGLGILIRFARLDGWRLLDATVLPFTAAFALARTGCFLNGCCAGKITTSPLGLPFPAAQTAARQLAQLTGSSISMQLGQYPTQLYELALALAGLAFMIGIRALWSRTGLAGRPSWPAGTAFLTYAIWFTAMRWVILPLRDYPYSEAVTHVAYPALYAAITVTGVILLKRRIMAAAA